MSPKKMFVQEISSSVGKGASELLKPLVGTLPSPAMDKRRLLPIRHLGMICGHAQSITYCLRQQPCLLPLSQVGLS